MRNRRTSLEAKLTVTLSFSAHSTGSLAFVTSTARGSATASGLASIRSEMIAANAAQTHLPLVGRGWGWGESRQPMFCNPPLPNPPPRRVEDAPPARWGRESGCRVWLALQDTIDVPRVGGVRQGGEVGGHVGLADPVIEGQGLAFAERYVERVVPERG